MYLNHPYHLLLCHASFTLQLVLLALVGLASCRTTLIGGNKARDVTIYYT